MFHSQSFSVADVAEGDKDDGNTTEDPTSCWVSVMAAGILGFGLR